MKDKRPFPQTKMLDVLGLVVTLTLLMCLGWYLNSFFVSRSEQPSQTANRSSVTSQPLLLFPPTPNDQKHGTDKTPELIDEFTDQVLPQHRDLQEILQAGKIQDAHKVGSSQGKKSQDEIWIIEVIDKSYLTKSSQKQASVEKPRRQFIVTNSFWRDVLGPLPVECMLNQIVPVHQTDQVDTLILEETCSIAPVAFLIRASTGEKIPLTDPNQLVPENAQWMITADGGASGLYKGLIPAKKPLFQVDYTGAYASAYFNAETGELLDLVLFDELLKKEG
jgi:hypothetical protein